MKDILCTGQVPSHAWSWQDSPFPTLCTQCHPSAALARAGLGLGPAHAKNDFH